MDGDTLRRTKTIKMSRIIIEMQFNGKDELYVEFHCKFIAVDKRNSNTFDTFEIAAVNEIQIQLAYDLLNVAERHDSQCSLSRFLLPASLKCSSQHHQYVLSKTIEMLQEILCSVRLIENTFDLNIFR